MMAEARASLADTVIVWLVGRVGGEAQVQAFEPLKKSNVFPLRLCLNSLEPHSLQAVKEISATVVRRIAAERLSDGWCVGVSVARCE